MSGFKPAVLSTTEAAAAVPTDLIWRLSLDQYHAMIQTGILTDDDPIELLEGWLVSKMPKNPLHSVVTRLLRQSLENLVCNDWYVDSQEPITTADSEPEPDVVVVRGQTQHYLDRHPGPDEVSLVIEVADSTLQRDRTTKKRLYARARIPVYWIINLAEQQCEVYRDPTGPTDQPDYRQRRDYGLLDTIPVVIQDVEIGHLDVRDLFPQTTP